MAFDIQVWQKRVERRLTKWRPRWEKAQAAGVNSLYLFLSAMTLWPVVEAAQQGDWGALAALGGVLAGVGSNLLANQIQSWKDETDAALRLTQAVAENEAVQRELDAVLERMEVIALARSGLAQADRDWFAQRLGGELSRLGNLERYQAALLGSGAIAQGEGAVAAGAGGVAVVGGVGGSVVTGEGGRAISAGTYIEKQEVHPDPAQSPAEKARRRYLKRLYQRCNVLPLAALGGEEGIGDEVTLEQVYVALDTRTMVALSERGKERRQRGILWNGRDERPLTTLEVATKERRLVHLCANPTPGSRRLAA